MGKSASNDLSSVFSSSPIHDGTVNADAVKEFFQTAVLDGTVNDGGHTFGELNRDYTGSPDYGDVETGDAGKPASAWVPNPTSPGPGSLDPSKQSNAPEGYGTTPSDTWGSGVGSQLSPKNSSDAISRHTLGDYGLGKSSQ
jgi:hypothetical protein